MSDILDGFQVGDDVLIVLQSGAHFEGEIESLGDGFVTLFEDEYVGPSTRVVTRYRSRLIDIAAISWREMEEVEVDG